MTKMTDEALEDVQEVLRDSGRSMLGDMLRSHIAALEAERDEARQHLAESATRLNEVIASTTNEADALRKRVQALERDAEQDRRAWTGLQTRCSIAESRIAAIRQWAKPDPSTPETDWWAGHDEAKEEVRVLLGDDAPAPEAVETTVDMPASMQFFALQPEPSTAEAFARARECLGMHEADSIQEDGLYALSLLERRMGAMERALRNLRDYAAGFEAWTSPPPVIAEATAALTDAPDVFTREEVERVLHAYVYPDVLREALTYLDALRKK